MTKKNFELLRKATEDEELSLKAKGLFLYLFQKPADWRGHISDIMKHSKVGRYSVLAAAKELQRRGYIKTITDVHCGKIVDRYYMVLHNS